MSSGTVAVIIVIALALIAVGAGIAATQRRMRLQRKFGPEYDRVANEQHSKVRADAELTERERRVRKLDIRPLPEQSRRRYQSDWVAVQERFVDTPRAAVAEAYELVTAVMREQGYPAADYNQVAADLSVRHPQMLQHFRSAHEVSETAAGHAADTEELRRAVISYRDLFADLLGEPLEQSSTDAGQPEPAVQPDGGSA
jgi:hypothetical protein